MLPTRRPLEDQNPIVLELLRLAAEIILAHPGAAPPALYDLCDTWADDLASALSWPGSSTAPRDHREADAPMQDREAAPASSLLTAGTVGRGITDEAPITTAQGGQPR